MKKTFLALLLVVCVAASSLTAGDMDFVSANLSGGFSLIQKLPSFGGNAKYQYAAQIDRHAYFGIGSSTDFDFLFPNNDLNVAVAVSAGPVIVIAPDARSTVNIMLGPAIYAETGRANSGTRYDYATIGITADAFYTYYPGSYTALGLTIGATGYLFFTNFADKTSSSNRITGDIKGYVGFTWRSGDIPEPAGSSYLVY